MVLLALALFLATSTNVTLPRYEWNYCWGEGCCFGKWQAQQDVFVYAEPKEAGKPSFTIRRGAAVTTLTGVMITKSLGTAELLKPLRTQGGVLIPSGEEIHLLHYLGEGEELFEYQGKIQTALIGSERAGLYPAQNPVIRVLIEPEYEYWVQLRSADRSEGWAMAMGRFVQQCGKY
jgi:hypothetical protein